MRREISTGKIATTFIGMVLGAGFASGQEILQFFGFFGWSGVSAVALASLFFIFFGFLVMQAGNRLKARSYLDLINSLAGPRVSRAVDLTVTFFLFGTLSIMLAGAGAIFVEQFGLPGWWGSLLVMAVSVLTVWFGMAGVVSAMGVIIPVLLVFILAIGLGTLLQNYPALTSSTPAAEPSLAPVSFWPFSSLLYTSYNLLTGIAILVPLGGMVEHGRIKGGAVLGGLTIGCTALVILLSLLAHHPQVKSYQVPMLYIAGQLYPPLSSVYSLALLSGMYTASVGCLYGFAARWSSPFAGGRFKALVLCGSLLGFIAARFGFSTLVRILYPLAGLAGLFILGSITYRFLSRLLNRAS
ncbi:MAG: hypothetical protein HPY50_08460 [Firmicutes bacterium]|nr:hypothetical protein [Bacillota bacterium]